MRFRPGYLVLLLIAVLMLPRAAHAQAPVNQPPVDRVRLVTTGGVSPVTNDVPITAITGPVACTATPAGVVHNPTAFQYKVNSTDTQCWKYTDSGNGVLASLPFGPASGTYTSTLLFVTTTNVTSLASPSSNPFDHPGTAPGAPPLLVVLP